MNDNYLLVPFNKPPYIGSELDYVKEAVVKNNKLSGDGSFTKRCSTWLEDKFNVNKALLTTSGTSALEMAAILSDIKPGDEVILPSFTFSTTATSFVMQGAHLVFVDIRPDTKNIDEKKIEAAITDKTKVVVPVHYAGVSSEMDTILDIAKEHNLLVVEDAAQGVMSTYKGQHLGTIGDFGCYSFHETKNYSMGEGGAILINNLEYIERAEIIREKGTNRSRYFRGQVDKYTWVDIGSSYLPSEIGAAYLWGQLENADLINNDRLKTWNRYYVSLKPLSDKELIEIPFIPDEVKHNAHMFYIVCRSLDERTRLIEYCKERGVQLVFHYIPLHLSPAGVRFGRFSGKDIYTTDISERLVRLPLYFGMAEEEQIKVVNTVYDFYMNEA